MAKKFFSENSKRLPSDNPPIVYEDRNCIEAVTNAIMEPKCDDGVKFWRELRNKQLQDGESQAGYQYRYSNNFPFIY